MKKKILIGVIGVMVASAGMGAHGEIVLAEPAVGTVATLENPESFSMIVLSDPQSYTKYAANQPLFELQTAWVAQNAERLKVRGALVTGDIVEQNNKLVAEGLPKYPNGDQTSRQQWEAASRAMSRLDGKVNYMISQGNHDVGYLAAENRYSLQPEYFTPERNPLWATSLVSTCANYQGIHTMENAAYDIEDPNWGKLLVVAVEFAPRDGVLTWVRELTESDRFRNHRVILLIHAFLNHKSEIIQQHKTYQLKPHNAPQEVWDKLVAGSKNIDMIVCGHAGVPPKMEGVEFDDVDYSVNSGFRMERRDDGVEVPIMMFNAQTGDGEWFGNGGDGWIRIMEFKPDGHTIGVRTFSPLFAQSKLTRDLVWRRAPYDEFEFRMP